MADNIKKFFPNTLESLGRKNRSEIQDNALIHGGEGFGTFCPFSPREAFSEDDMVLRSSVGDFENDCLADSVRLTSSQMTSEHSYSLDYAAAAGHRLIGDDYEPATYSSADFRTSNGASDCSPCSNYSGSFFGQYYRAPPLLQLPNSSTENGHSNQSKPSGGVEEKPDLVPWLEDRMGDLGMVNTCQSFEDNWDSFCSCSSATSSPKTSVLESLSLDFRERDSSSVVDAESLDPLADLTGDYDSHIRSLYYGQCCLGYALSAPVLFNTPASPSQFQNKMMWDTVHQPKPLRSLSFSHMNSNALEPPARIARSYSVFTSEEKNRGRGTGTFLPVMVAFFFLFFLYSLFFSGFVNIIYHVIPELPRVIHITKILLSLILQNSSYGMDRPSQGKMRNKASGTYGQYQRQNLSNGYAPPSTEANASVKGSHEFAANANGPVQPRKRSSGIRHQSYHPKEGDGHGNGNGNGNGYINSSSMTIEFGTLGQHLPDVGGSTSRASPDKQQTSTSDPTKKGER